MMRTPSSPSRPRNDSFAAGAGAGFASGAEERIPRRRAAAASDAGIDSAPSMLPHPIHPRHETQRPSEEKWSRRRDMETFPGDAGPAGRELAAAEDRNGGGPAGDVEAPPAPEATCATSRTASGMWETARDPAGVETGSIPANRLVRFWSSQQKAPQVLSEGLFVCLGAGAGFEPATFRL